MGLINVYEANVLIGPNIMGEVYSFRPIPTCVYPAVDTGIDGHGVELSRCTRFVIETPDHLVMVTDPVSGMESLPDPERPDEFITLGPRVVRDRALRGDAFRLVQIYWQYWENREAADRFEEFRRQSSAGGESVSTE